jgi:hypothetical protein
MSDSRHEAAAVEQSPQQRPLRRLAHVGVNGILLGWMMCRTGLMPPGLAMLGVIGGPLN